ncbi:hypothetical protein [Amycolatopsis sp.]|nr:hypothetical protein [Amycolatopsis sp.]
MVIAAMAQGSYDPTGWVEEITLDEVEHALVELRAGLGMKALVVAKPAS